MLASLTALTDDVAVDYARGERVEVRTDRPTTLRLKRQRRGTWIRLEDVHFDHDSAITLPSALPVVGTALDALWQAGRAGDAHEAFIAGHTDTSGGAAYNVRLSVRRAEGVHDLLLGRADAWAARVVHHDGAAQASALRRVLAWAATALRWTECDAPAGLPGDELSPAELEAARGFVRRAQRLLDVVEPEPAIPSHELWTLVFRVFEQRLLAHTGLDEAGLAQVRQAIRFVPGGEALGLGERYPLVEPGRDGYRCQENRRVEVAFFVPDQAPRAGQLEQVYDPERYVMRTLRPRDAATVFATELPPGDVVFLLDVSGSMAVNPAGGYGTRDTRLARCQQELVAMIDNLPAARRFSVVAFSGALRFFRQDGARPALVHASPEEKEAAKAFVLGLRPTGSTQGMKPALARALEAPGVGAIVLLSDGVPEFRKDEGAEGFLADLAARNPARADSPHGKRRVRIDTYGFTRDNEAGVDLMRRLADGHDGVFTPIEEGPARTYADDRAHVNVHVAGGFEGLGHHGDLAAEADRHAFARDLMAGVQRIFDQVGIFFHWNVDEVPAAALRRAGDGLLDGPRAVCGEDRSRHLLAPAGVDLYGELGAPVDDPDHRRAHGVDLFLVHHFLEDGVLGKSPTPGRLAGNGPGTALVVAAFAKHGDSITPMTLDEIAHTAAHELGHFLGLPHTTTFLPDARRPTSTQDDGIDDTPRCAVLADRNGDGFVAHGDGCPDAGNLMFWAAAEGSTALSKGQGEVMRAYLAINEH